MLVLLHGRLLFPWSKVIEELYGKCTVDDVLARREFDMFLPSGG